jgi:DNA-binding MarR family transcriptional regulator
MRDTDTLSIQRFYPQIYFACHVDHVRQASTAFRLSSHDSGILSHLSEEHPVTPSQLVRHVGVTPSTFSPQLDRLVRLGYVERRQSARDRRRWELRLTRRGAEAMAATSVLDAGRVQRVLSRLSPNERRRAVKGMALLARAASEVTAQKGRRR